MRSSTLIGFGRDSHLSSTACSACEAVSISCLQACATVIPAGNLFPQTQQATADYTHVQKSRNVANPLPQIAFDDFAVGANLSWELDFWGRFRRAVESANATLDASVENYDDALVTLLADVATNYVQYRVAQMRIKIARDNLRSQEKLVALADQQFKVGTATSVDAEQLRTLVEQTRSTIPFLQIVLGQANDTLCILLGIPPRDLEAELGPGPELNAEPLSTLFFGDH